MENHKQLFITLIFGLFIISSCKNTPKTEYYKLQGETMGTYYAITFEGSNPDELKEKVDSILIDVNNALSTYIPSSTISSINSSKETSFAIQDVHSHFDNVYQIAQEIEGKTNGYLNTAIAPLVNHWGFGFTPKEKISSVDSQKVQQLLSLIDSSTLNIVKKNNNELEVVKKPIHAQFDYSSIAKGYGIDHICNYLRKEGYTNFLVDIGGEARAEGKNPSAQLWTLAISKPKEDAAPSDLEVIVQLDDMSMATSGNYRQFYEVDGKKFAHIINPKTGFPALSNLLSATVIAKDCATADGYATSLMVMGYEEAKTYIEKNELIACLIYDENGDDELEKYFSKSFVNYTIPKE